MVARGALVAEEELAEAVVQVDARHLLMAANIANSKGHQFEPNKRNTILAPVPHRGKSMHHNIDTRRHSKPNATANESDMTPLAHLLALTLLQIDVFLAVDHAPEFCGEYLSGTFSPHHPLVIVPVPLRPQ